ncbi:MAG: DUF885 family protein [Gemmatimonadaceae bacterium]
MRRSPRWTVVLVSFASLASAQTPKPAPKPADTEVWTPVPAIITPGRTNADAPSDAIVLFDGKSADQWLSANDDSPAKWTVANGVMTVNKPSGDIRTKRKFTNYQLHIEWRIPPGVTGSGQERGNSGVYLAWEKDYGYELQVLDSYENKTNDYLVPSLPEQGQREFLRTWNNSVIRLNHVVHHGGVGHHVQNWHAYHRARTRSGKIAAVDCASSIGMFCGGTMAEGWACYATQLVAELGFLTPLERLSEQHSRVRFLSRAIVDIELHQRTMSFGEAVRLYTDKVGMSAAAARGEAVKNSMFPCTAIMYWLGMQGILDLRDALRAKRGASFSLKGFHDELLGLGSIPVPLAARIMTEDRDGAA